MRASDDRLGIFFKEFWYTEKIRGEGKEREEKEKEGTGKEEVKKRRRQEGKRR